ncbi:MAG: 6-phosphogluconolactonase [Armatimonadota bacterium]|nr:MAG: 6-phosphogluconolactonase [Armatimonadota bacterium]
MSRPDKADLRVYPNLKALSQAVAESVVELAKAAVEQSGRFTIALSGGKTPRRLYGLLARKHRRQVPWDKVQVFWGDERYVPPDDPRSDYRMARKMLLDRVPIPEGNMHPMPTLFPRPEHAAEAYQATLRAHFPGRWPRFDLILLGLGVDGHTASLFPNNPALDEKSRWVVAVDAEEADPPVRLTLTLPAINHAKNIYFVAAGKDKAPALQHALAAGPDPRAAPASAVAPVDGRLIWWVDRPAAR